MLDLAGYISRVSRAGKTLDGTDGWKPCDTDPFVRCYGIMQIPEYMNPKTDGGIGGLEYLEDSIELIIRSINSVSGIHFGLSDDQKTRGGIAAMDCGKYQILNEGE